MTYTLPIKIMFQHCDPAGIVFYPRYFEMINETVETFFEEAIGYPFATMHGRDGRGVPTVTIAADFKAPSRLGDVVDFAMTIVKVGNTSLGYELKASCAGEVRLEATGTLVHINDQSGRPVPWSDEVRTKLKEAAAF
ncbi:MAG: thioesterase family protein [Pseudomonadota bacterium]